MASHRWWGAPVSRALYSSSIKFHTEGGFTWLNKQLVGTLWFYGRMDVTLMGRRTFAEVVCAR